MRLLKDRGTNGLGKRSRKFAGSQQTTCLERAANDDAKLNRANNVDGRRAITCVYRGEAKFRTDPSEGVHYVPKRLYRMAHLNKFIFFRIREAPAPRLIGRVAWKARN